VCALLVLTGCTSEADNEAEPDTQEGVSAEQAAALDDKVVTEDGYTARYLRLVARVADKGYTVLGVYRLP
jgi:hypothetical protein